MGKGTTSAPASPARRRRHRVSPGSHSPQATLASGSCLRCASRTASLIWSQILSGEGTAAIRAARRRTARNGTDRHGPSFLHPALAPPGCAKPGSSTRCTQRSPCRRAGLLAWNSRHFPVKLQLQPGQSLGSATYGITDRRRHPHHTTRAPQFCTGLFWEQQSPLPHSLGAMAVNQRHPGHRRRPWPRPFRPDLGEDGEGGSAGRGSG